MDLYARAAPFYDLIYGPLVDYSREVDLLEEIFSRYSVRPVRRVLDLGCGTGNHSLALAERGYDVRGVDLSPAFIKMAQEKSQTSDPAPQFAVGDMRDLGKLGRFDALICMFGAFGHLPRAEVGAALRGFRERLEPGGILAFEWWNESGARDGLQDWLEREEEGLHLIRMGESRLDEATHDLLITFKHLMLRGDRVEDTFTEQGTMTLHRAGTLDAHLTDAGLTPLAMLDWTQKTLESHQADDFRVLAVARNDGGRNVLGGGQAQPPRSPVV